MIIVSISISDLFPPSLLFISSFHLCVDFCNSLAETKLLLYYTSSWNEGFFSGLGSRKIFFLAPATRFFFSVGSGSGFSFFFIRVRLWLLIFFRAWEPANFFSAPAPATRFFQSAPVPAPLFFSCLWLLILSSAGSASGSEQPKNDRLPSSVFFISLFFRVTIFSDQNQ